MTSDCFMFGAAGSGEHIEYYSYQGHIGSNLIVIVSCQLVYYIPQMGKLFRLSNSVTTTIIALMPLAP